MPTANTARRMTGRSRTARATRRATWRRVAGDATENTETAAIIRADVERVRNGLDEIGKQILEMVAAGKTEREIGKAVGISNVAVHKRIVKMRAALENLRIA